jgi:hypothetical protein
MSIGETFASPAERAARRGSNRERWERIKIWNLETCAEPPPCFFMQQTCADLGLPSELTKISTVAIMERRKQGG